ncbi:hypothetical protein [Escherichia coli]|uniref:hypothetical protein n=1 Tax=Escherichia coli TaxID=562 RepID=UPI00201A8EEC|nr:hypothetical protein [Escherichia coli]
MSKNIFPNRIIKKLFRFKLLKTVGVALLLSSHSALADYGRNAVISWANEYQSQHGAMSLYYEYNRYGVDPQVYLIREINRAWQSGVVAAQRGRVINDDEAYEYGLRRIQRLRISQALGNDVTLSLTNLWVKALHDGWNYGNANNGSVTQSSTASATSNSAPTFSCKVDVTYQGKRSHYMDEAGAWDQVITDYGTYFSWDLPRGNRGNSTGQDAFSGMDETQPVLNNKLIRKETEKDGSTVDEFRTEVSYGSDQPVHKFVYARRIKPNGIREYYVTDLTDKRAFMFLNCQQD